MGQLTFQPCDIFQEESNFFSLLALQAVNKNHPFLSVKHLFQELLSSWETEIL